MLQIWDTLLHARSRFAPARYKLIARPVPRVGVFLTSREAAEERARASHTCQPIWIGEAPGRGCLISLFWGTSATAEAIRKGEPNRPANAYLLNEGDDWKFEIEKG